MEERGKAREKEECSSRWLGPWMEWIQLNLRVSWLLGVWLSARESLERDGYLFLLREISSILHRDTHTLARAMYRVLRFGVRVRRLRKPTLPCFTVVRWSRRYTRHFRKFSFPFEGAGSTNFHSFLHGSCSTVPSSWRGCFVAAIRQGRG